MEAVNSVKGMVIMGICRILSNKLSWAFSLIISAVIVFNGAEYCQAQSQSNATLRLAKQIEKILLDAPQNYSYGAGRDQFDALGCDRKVVGADVDQVALVRRLLKNNPRLVSNLKSENSVDAVRVLALLQERNLLPGSRIAYAKIALEKGDWYFLERANPLYSSSGKEERATFYRVNKALKEAAQSGSGTAALKLSSRTRMETLINYGFEGDPDVGGDHSSFYWLRLGAELGSVEAQSSYSATLYGYASGRGGGRRWLLRASRGGDIGANRLIGNQYIEKSDFDFARNYLCRAVFFGDRGSGQMLSVLSTYEQRQAEVSPGRLGSVTTVASLGSKTYTSADYFSSVVKIDPVKNLTITEVSPDIYGCTGLCFIEITLRDRDGENLGSSYWQGGSSVPFSGGLGVLKYPVQLVVGESYELTIKVWSSESIGFQAAGQYLQYAPEIVRLETISIDPPSLGETGPISFDLLQAVVATPTPIPTQTATSTPTPTPTSTPFLTFPMQPYQSLEK